jgi:hypothetical protein
MSKAKLQADWMDTEATIRHFVTRSKYEDIMAGNELVPTTINRAEVIACGNQEEAEQTATFMANEFAEATAMIRKLMLGIKEQTDRLEAVFAKEDAYKPFDISFEYSSYRQRAYEPDAIFNEMRRRVWRILADAIGVKNIMSVMRRQEFEDQLNRGELPEIDAATLLGIIRGLMGQAKQFAEEAAKEVFEILRPQGAWGGQYKTNNAFRVGRKVILSWYVEESYRGQLRLNYHHEPHLIAIDGIFHLLDGKGIMRENRGPLIKAILESKDGRGETHYFKFKCFKNRNLHMEMKRLDLVMELNRQASGDYVLGNDPE